MNGPEKPYRLSFTTGGLFLNESVAVARLYREHGDLEAALAAALDGRVAALPKTVSQRRSLREIVVRLSCLRHAELIFLVECDDRGDRSALLWLATCRAYGLVREYVVEVVRERWLERRLDLPPASFERYFEDRAEWNAQLDAIRPSTRSKLRQILFRIMREAGVVGADHTIQPVPVSPALYALLSEAEPSDLDLFPGIERKGEGA